MFNIKFKTLFQELTNLTDEQSLVSYLVKLSINLYDFEEETIRKF